MEKFLKKRPADSLCAEREAKAAKADDAPTTELELLQHLEPHSAWRHILRNELSKPYMRELDRKVGAERLKHQVFPQPHEVFACLNFTPPEEVRVVILGQDPYHGPGQAHGFCFSVNRGVAIPPSLKNIYTELADDVPGFMKPSHGNLESWARQGVLLLNASLTVRKGEPNSHAAFGWQTFTDAVIKQINEQAQHVVFILWGGFAQKKGKMINRQRHKVLEAAHPSPLSVTKFRGCKVFSQANTYLKSKGRVEIDWRVPEE
ncbi:hypothetical protein AB1Y20_017919 [Prymnesium parvum]|uniref:Uracil-DNA glycosylase n=1 Tax=Prymnesium parvum TaxID=97485 RepID=A0AB34JPS6_PRYPA